MSTNNNQHDPMETGTKPVKEHAWLQKLIGEWRVETEMIMEPGKPKEKTTGTASVKSLGGLWAYSEDKGKMPDGNNWLAYFTIGYDVSFKEYRAGWIGSMSSHLWTYVGTLSDDGKTMTLNCEGPSMVKDGETALYRDVIELIDDNHRTLTSFGQDDNGEWQEWMKSHYYRA